AAPKQLLPEDDMRPHQPSRCPFQRPRPHRRLLAGIVFRFPIDGYRLAVTIRGPLNDRHAFDELVHIRSPSCDADWQSFVIGACRPSMEARRSDAGALIECATAAS